MVDLRMEGWISPGPGAKSNWPTFAMRPPRPTGSNWGHSDPKSIMLTTRLSCRVIVVTVSVVRMCSANLWKFLCCVKVAELAVWWHICEASVVCVMVAELAVEMASVCFPVTTALCWHAVMDQPDVLVTVTGPASVDRDLSRLFWGLIMLMLNLKLKTHF